MSLCGRRGRRLQGLRLRARLEDRLQPHERVGDRRRHSLGEGPEHERLERRQVALLLQPQHELLEVVEDCDLDCRVDAEQDVVPEAPEEALYPLGGDHRPGLRDGAATAALHGLHLRGEHLEGHRGDGRDNTGDIAQYEFRTRGQLEAVLHDRDDAVVDVEVHKVLRACLEGLRAHTREEAQKALSSGDGGDGAHRRRIAAVRELDAGLGHLHGLQHRGGDDAAHGAGARLHEPDEHGRVPRRHRGTLRSRCARAHGRHVSWCRRLRSERRERR
mmetsp:Transcript_2863/g.8089  ORF Transcript_2863/g.8089 Transcript_2863/m.8089 type:complete len:274 (-) Transcript_2863:23-844(-)